MSPLVTILLLFAICGTFNASIIIALGKFGIIRNYETNKKTWMPQFCDFCLSFWMALVFCVLFIQVAGIDWSWEFIVAPFCSAAITFNILK